MNTEIEIYAQGRSCIHQWAPRSKLVGLGLLVMGYATVRSLWLVPIMLGVTVLLYAASGLPLCFLRSRLRYPSLFLLGVVATLPWLSGTTVLWHWGPLALRQEGVLTMVLVVSRFCSILTLGIILLGSTPFLQLVGTLRGLGLPDLLADMALLAYRYLFDIADQLSRLKQSMRLRGFSFHRTGTWQPLAAVTGTLLIRTYEQSERVYKAMRLRGYGSGPGVSFQTQTWGRPPDVMGVVGCGAITLTLILIPWFLTSFG
ncbi:MAG: cobalt ECF transporter T component CbiQ [Cyanobacteria bacterium P01_A01_bin.105]